MKLIYKLLEAIKRRYRSLQLSKVVVTSLFTDESEIDALKSELLSSQFLRDLKGKLDYYRNLSGKTVRGNSYDLGTMDDDEASLLYAIVRKSKPSIVVETGVCNGYSSAVILYALFMNKSGELHSIDFPEVAEKEYSEETFWPGKGGAVIPSDQSSGWIVPDELRSAWHLYLGKSQDLLPRVIEQLDYIDIFIHDSEHSYECMMFEYKTAYPALRSGGLLISDDISWNSSFYDFSRHVDRKPGYVAGNMGMIIK